MNTLSSVLLFVSSLVAGLLLSNSNTVNGQLTEIKEPIVIRSDSTVWSMNITTQLWQFVSPTLTFTTRTYCCNGVCSIPACTISVKPGDQLTVFYQNMLAPDPPEPANAMDTLVNPNTTNIHTHGLHIDPNVDYIFATVEGGQGWVYKYHIHPQHSPGFHWWHAHLHGAATLHLLAGLYGSLIVEPSPTFHPKTLAFQQKFNSFVTFFHHFKFGSFVNDNFLVNSRSDPTCPGANDAPPGNPNAANPFPVSSYDYLSGFYGSTVGLDFVTTPPAATTPFDHYFVNGIQGANAQITLLAGESRNLRMVNGAGGYDLYIIFPTQATSGCTFVQFAADGVYQYSGLTIRGSPDNVTPGFGLVLGARADIQVTCQNVGSWPIMVQYDLLGTDTLLTLNIVSPSIVLTDQLTYQVTAQDVADCVSEFPPYLQDLRTATATQHNSIRFSEGTPPRPAGMCMSWIGMGPDCSSTYVNGLIQSGTVADPVTFQWPTPGTVANPQCTIRPFIGPGGGTGSNPGTPNSQYRFVTPLGQVNQWTFWGEGNPFHPVHIHVLHYQVISFVQDADSVNLAGNQNALYYTVGDYHDTIPGLQGLTTVRFLPLDYVGEAILHCHFLRHEDTGMMDSFYICDASAGACGANVTGPPTTGPPTTAIPTTMLPTTLAPSTLAPTTVNLGPCSGPFSWSVTANSPTSYMFGANANPTLTLLVGITYSFQLNTPNDPFLIVTAPGAGTANLYTGPGLSSQGATSGTVTFTPPAALLGATLNYQSQVNAAMTAVISFADPNTCPATTAPPTTMPPSTLVPSTMVPSTASTAVPTTPPGATPPPTTFIPSTGPSTAVPTTLVPSTLIPSTMRPSTLVPSTLTPSTLAPTTSDAPVVVSCTVAGPASFATQTVNQLKTTLSSMFASALGCTSDRIVFNNIVRLSGISYPNHLMSTGNKHTDSNQMQLEAAGPTYSVSFNILPVQANSPSNTAAPQQTAIVLGDMIVQNALTSSSTFTQSLVAAGVTISNVPQVNLPTNQPAGPATPVLSFSSTVGTLNTNLLTGLVTISMNGYIPNPFNQPVLIPVYAPMATTGNNQVIQAVLWGNCQNAACSQYSYYNYICISAATCGSVAGVGYFTLSYLAPPTRLVSQNILQVTTVLGHTTNYIIQVTWQGGPTIPQWLVQPITQQVVPQSIFLNVLNGTMASWYVSTTFYATLPQYVNFYAPWTNGAAVNAANSATLMIQCNDPACNTAQGTTSICIDTQSCNAVAVGQSGYFTIPTILMAAGQTSMRSLLTLTGANGWTTMYFIDIIVSPATLPPTTAVPTTLIPSTHTPTSPKPTTLVPSTKPPTTMVPSTLVPSTTAPTTAIPYTYHGCYADNGNPHILPVGLGISNTMTTSLCYSLAKAQGLAYFATEYSTQCYGASISQWTPGAVSGACGMACAADNTQVCGGFLAASVYSIP